MEGPQPTLVLLDIMLPEEDGLSILQKLRASAATKRLPVIMLTAKNTEYDRVVGLDSGADDFISKPFGMMELVARVRAVLRRTEQKQETEDYRVGDLFISPSAMWCGWPERKWPSPTRNLSCCACCWSTRASP